MTLRGVFTEGAPLKTGHPVKRSKKICIIIPTYNERGNLERLVPMIQDVLHFRGLADLATLLVVDDNSPDSTGQLAEELTEAYDNVQVLHRPAKRGIGSAYRQGFAYALQQLGSDIVFEMDADLSHDPKHLPDFLSKVEEGYDAVVGSRRVPGGGVADWSFNRNLMSTVANQLARRLCGVRVRDSTSGYRVFTRRALQRIGYSSLESEGYAFQVEMLFRCQREGLKVAEVPIVFVERRMGETKLSRAEMLRFIFTCLKLFFRRGASQKKCTSNLRTDETAKQTISGA